MANVIIRTGREGPVHDPYHFEEVTFMCTDGSRIMMHLGLVVWIEFDGYTPKGWDERTCAKFFEYFTGMSIDKAFEIPNKLRSRRDQNMTMQERIEFLQMEEAASAIRRYAQ